MDTGVHGLLPVDDTEGHITGVDATLQPLFGTIALDVLFAERFILPNELVTSSVMLTGDKEAGKNQMELGNIIIMLILLPSIIN